VLGSWIRADYGLFFLNLTDVAVAVVERDRAPLGARLEDPSCSVAGNAAIPGVDQEKLERWAFLLHDGVILGFGSLKSRPSLSNYPVH
jgi:hypothetical protein